jgi:hypothetical protein
MAFGGTCRKMNADMHKARGEADARRVSFQVKTDDGAIVTLSAQRESMT